VNFKLGCKSKELVQEILELVLERLFPNVISLRIFVSLPASLASGERILNVFKQVKNYYGLTTGQFILNGFSTMNINSDLA
jgi:hypothetical protein